MSWHQIHLTSDENIAGKQFQVQNAFAPVIMVNSAPTEFAIFSRFNSIDGSVDIFVPPELAAVTSSQLATFRGQVCQKPRAGSVGLLVGNQNALEHFALWQR